MICAGCSHEVGPRARFCEICGAPLPKASAPSAGAPTGSAPDSRARVYAALPALIAFLQREGCVSYRALAHVFNGDQAFLDAAREELTFKRPARDEHGQGLVWTAEPMPGLPPTADVARAQPASPAAAVARPPAVSAPAPEDSGQAGRRQLTVMFCDLADSTVLAGRLDAEDLREVIRSYQATAAEVVQRFAGHIAQYLGDGLLVYLGWPEAHEDDATRAVRAGLGIVEAIAILRETDALRRHGAELLELSREHRLGFWRALATPFFLETEEAERAVRVYGREFNAGLTVPQQLWHVADSYASTGRTEDAARVLAEARELMEQQGDVYWEPELLRLSGRLAAAEGRGAPVEAVTAFERALRLARERGTHLLELRAATDLARLQARKVLAPVYGLFTDGADVADVQDARAVLAGLDGPLRPG